LHLLVNISVVRSCRLKRVLTDDLVAVSV